MGRAHLTDQVFYDLRARLSRLRFARGEGGGDHFHFGLSKAQAIRIGARENPYQD